MANEHAISKISIQWIQSFISKNNLVIRRQTGNLSPSPEKEAYIRKSVAFHLGVLKRGFKSGSLDESAIENPDETHFCFNVDNGRTIRFRGDENFKYADVVSGDEGITMTIRVTACVNASIEIPVLVFRNKKCSYPIRGLKEDVSGVCYRVEKKGWMDSRVFQEWLQELRAIRALPVGRKGILYVNNCSGHNETDGISRACGSINTEFRKLPANATNLVQLADYFFISKIKIAWRRVWDQ